MNPKQAFDSMQATYSLNTLIDCYAAQCFIVKTVLTNCNFDLRFIVGVFGN